MNKSKSEAKPIPGKLDEKNDVSSANEEMKRKFAQDDADVPPHADKVGGLRGNPS